MSQVKKHLPGVYKTGETTTHAWQDNDSHDAIADKLDEYFPQANIKDSYLYRTHKGDLQWQHVMGENTEETVNNAVTGAVKAAQEYWALTKEGKNIDAGIKLGNALHYVQDSYSMSHTYRNYYGKGKINKAFDYNLQSGHEHAHDDEVPATHESRQQALDSSVEYLRLVHKYKNNPEGLDAALRKGIFATDINESIETRRQKRADWDDVIESGNEHIHPEFGDMVDELQGVGKKLLE